MDYHKLNPAQLAQLPALPPPPGVKSQFDHPTDTMVKPLTIVNALFVSLAFITVAVRMSTRRFISRQGLGWDDWICALAMLGSIVHTTLSLDNMNIGYGRHFWDIRAISLSGPKIMRLSSIDIVYGAVIYIVKLSILLLYYRLFSVYASSRKLVFGGVFIITLITLPYIAVAIARTVICAGFSVVLEHLTFCYTRPVNTSIIAFGAANMISDFYILAIPLRRVNGLHINRKAKLGLLMVFVVGFIACIMSLARLIFVAINFDNSDVFYRGASTSIFSAIEMNLAIMCSCSITFPAFYRRGIETVQPVLRSISKRTSSKDIQAKANLENGFQLNGHGLLDGEKGSRLASSNGSDKPPKTADLPPHVSLIMTRATIDIESQGSGRFD